MYWCKAVPKEYVKEDVPFIEHSSYNNIWFLSFDGEAIGSYPIELGSIPRGATNFSFVG